MAPPEVVPVRAERVVGFEPDPFYDPALVRAWADEVDVVHLHFGYDHLTAADARAWADALRENDLPLVITVHDLRNPHHVDRGQHDEVLGVLVPAAAAVLTLTPGAAVEIERRLGRTAVVVAHPTVVGTGRSEGVQTEPGLVALHLKSLRTNVLEPLPILVAAARGAARAGGRLEVDVHPEALADPRLAGLDDRLATLAVELGPDVVRLRVHERFDDAELERYLRRAQVTVLPYRWGTHSGWLELARDLGTRVVAPSGGHYADQWAEVVTYGSDEEHGLDPTSLADAVAKALRLPALDPAPRPDRMAEADVVRATHARTYAEVVA